MGQTKTTIQGNQIQTLDKEFIKKIKGLESYCDDLLLQLAWFRGEILKLHEANSVKTEKGDLE